MHLTKMDEHTTGSYITSAIDVHKNGLLATCIEEKKKGEKKKERAVDKWLESSQPFSVEL
jgi:hypothetical protein